MKVAPDDDDDCKMHEIICNDMASVGAFDGHLVCADAQNIISRNL